MSVVSVGWQTQAGYYSEASYGVIGNSVSLLWIGQLQTITETLDQSAILVYQMNGNVRFPAYILQGQRQPTLDVEFYPQDINLLTQTITNAVNNSTSIVVHHVDSGLSLTYNGLKAEKVSLSASVGDPITCTVSFQGSNVSMVSPATTAYPTDPGSIPFYWITSAVTLGTSSLINVLEWNMDLNNTLTRIYEFGQAYVRALPTMIGEVTGTFKMTFQDTLDVNAALNLTGGNLQFTLGGGHSITVLSCVLNQYNKSDPVKDYIAATFTYEGQGITVA